MSNEKIYEMVTQQIIDRLEEGTVPWKKPFHSGQAVNWKSQKAYRGINTLLLPAGEYATFKQIKEAGGKIIKGSKSSIVIFWKWIEKEDKETDETKKFPLLRYYRVFEINSQVEGMETKREEQIEYDHNPIVEAEKIRDGYMGGPSYSHAPGSAYYRPSEDRVNIPEMKEFEDVNRYYSTLFHELVHSTGSKDRLNREGIIETNKFGDETYSKEELVAELGASMLCQVAGIDNSILDDAANYIQSWLNALRNDKKLIVHASQQAQKASDHILGVTFEGSDK